MPMNLEVYEVKCTSCDWKEIVQERGGMFPGDFRNLGPVTIICKKLGMKTPAERKVRHKYKTCPECGREVTVKFMPVMF